MSAATDADLLRELRLIRGLLVASLLRSMDGGTQRDSIAALSNAGLPPAEIAEILGTTPGTVSVALAGLRKSGKARPVAKSTTVAKSAKAARSTKGAPDAK